MREHQIVITLKPEQFLEVQKMARAANAKSMGAFVRQRLLSALGIEGAAPTAEKPTSATDIEAVLSQMRRLHSELKVFVAESLSVYTPPQDEIEQIDYLPPPLPEDAEAEAPLAELEDELEEIASKNFAISPRLGPIETTDAISLKPVPVLPTVQELAAAVRDPLSELLGDNGDVGQSKEEDDEDEFFEEEDDEDDYVPLSVAERKRQLEQKSRAAKAAEEQDQDETDDEESDEEEDEKEADWSKWQNRKVETSDSSEKDDEEEEDIALNAAYDKPQEDEKQIPGVSQGLPPISGGPPPKRRQV